MATIDGVQVQLTADIGQFQTGFNQATQSVQSFQNATQTATAGNRTFYEGVAQAGEFATGSERGIRRMELAMGSLASQAVGTNHAVGQFSEGLLLFGGGSPLALAVLGGIAAIALAIKGLTEGSREAEQATKDLEKALDHMGKHGEAISLQVQAGAIESQIEHIKDIRHKLGLDDLEGMGILGTIAEKTSQLFGAGETDLIRLDAELHGVLTRMRQAQADFRGDETKKELERFEKDVREHNRRIEQLQQEDIAEWVRYGLQQHEAILANNARIEKLQQEDIAEWVRYHKQIHDEQQRALEKQARDAQEWGMRISHALVEGITGNLKSLGDLLKMAVEAFITKYLITPFLLHLGIKSPSSFGEYLGQMVVAGIGRGMVGKDVQNVGDMRLQLSVNTSGMPAASNPLAAARDQDWQRFMRESILVANANGFRG